MGFIISFFNTSKWPIQKTDTFWKPIVDYPEFNQILILLSAIPEVCSLPTSSGIQPMVLWVSWFYLLVKTTRFSFPHLSIRILAALPRAVSTSFCHNVEYWNIDHFSFHRTKCLSSMLMIPYWLDTGETHMWQSVERKLYIIKELAISLKCQGSNGRTNQYMRHPLSLPRETQLLLGIFGFKS